MTKWKKLTPTHALKDMIALDIIKSKCSKSVHLALNEGYASFISEMIAMSLTLGILSEIFLSCQNLNRCLCLLTKWNEDESLKYHCSFWAASILYCQCKGGRVCVRNFLHRPGIYFWNPQSLNEKCLLTTWKSFKFMPVFYHNISITGIDLP